MINEKLYSIRMRAAAGGAHEKGGKHISGGERLAYETEMEQITGDLLKKAFSHQRGKPDFFNLVIEDVKFPVCRGEPLFVSTCNVKDPLEGKRTAEVLLCQCGLTYEVINKALGILVNNFHVRGAIIIDANTGERLDNRKDKGVRVSQLDWRQSDYKNWCVANNTAENVRMKEALTLATKVCSHPATIAEICWSDDPNYITGYVASPKRGYERITKMKEKGDEHGGRLIFIDSLQAMDSYIQYLEKQPFMIRNGGEEK
ncbi:6-carboxyhexanoate--CoA ligase [Alteribacillus sp. JSM 102045]|uniref:6-carboxyhexanoate--CoA ligase n=1 Tax=Alteribacillus sp. JSM 102045 TaxID=1562101 RepID=UPI0035BF4E4D